MGRMSSLNHARDTRPAVITAKQSHSETVELKRVWHERFVEAGKHHCASILNMSMFHNLHPLFSTGSATWQAARRLFIVYLVDNKAIDQ